MRPPYAQAMSALPFNLADAEWLAHRHVEGQDAFRFVHVPRGFHATVPFLTDDHLGALTATQTDVPARQLLETLGKGPLHLLFHSAFCGSTLLARALAQPGVAMGLSEPVVLNDVVGFRQRGAAPAAVARCADAALRLLARPFGAGEAVVVKPSNVINPLAELLLALAPQARAVFLYAPLESFLVSVVRKGLPCRLWARELLQGYLPQGMIAPLGLGGDDLLGMADLQVAAVGWLAQHRLFAALAGKVGAHRLRTLDADRMTARPAEAIAAVAAHYGLALDAAAVAAGPAFARHSKSGAAFTPADRTREYAQARAAYANEIDIVLAWADKLAAQAGIAMEPPFPLLQAS